MNINKAVIVAAGLGSRLGELTRDIPKCMLKLGSKTVIEYSIDKLKANGITNIAIVVGYKNHILKNYLGENYTYIYNPFYKYTNNMASLWFAKEFIGNDDFIYSHADIFYHEDILKSLLKRDGEIVLSLEQKVCDGEAMKVKVDTELNFIESSKEIAINESIGEWIGLGKFNNPTWKEYLEEINILLENERFMEYDTRAMNYFVAKKPGRIKVDIFKDIPWVEIDYKEDYVKAVDILKKIECK